MKKQRDKKKQPDSPVNLAGLKAEDFAPLTAAQLGGSVRKAVKPKGGK